MVRTEGPRSLYSGLVAGLQRQMSFASVRIGLYDSMKQVYTRGSESRPMHGKKPLIDVCALLVAASSRVYNVVTSGSQPQECLQQIFRLHIFHKNVPLCAELKPHLMSP